MLLMFYLEAYGRGQTEIPEARQGNVAVHAVTSLLVARRPAAGVNKLGYTKLVNY